MEFTKVGKTYQLVVNNGQDLEDVLNLDEALWGATSAPAAIFHCDPALTAVLDPAKTGRFSSNAIKETIRWFLAQIKKPADVNQDFKGNLSLDAIKPESQALIDSAEYILKEIGAPAGTINLKQIRDFFASVAKRPFNGDGTISLSGAAEIEKSFPGFVDVMKDTIAATGGTPDADGTIGATEKNVNDFLAAAKDYLAWLDLGAIPAGKETTDIMVRGTDTPALAALVKAIDPQVTQFFKLSGLLGFDERIAPKSMSPAAKVDAFDPANQAEVDAYLQSLPIAKPNAASKLPFDLDVINPIHRKAWNDVVTKVLKPFLGDDTTDLTPEQWASVKALFAPYEAYIAGKKGTIAEKIAVDKLRKYVAMTDIAKMTADAAARDKVVTDIINAAKQVEKLLLLWANLIRLINNFVSFPELYDADRLAMFECGKLVIDGRWFNLTFAVDNVAAHQAIAKNSLLCIIYVEVNKGAAGKINLVAPVTYGSQGNLAAGKRGVYFDLDGKEYDATITQIVVNPVCVREALRAPFIKMWSMVEGKIENWSGNAEKSMTASFDKAISDPTAVAQKPATPPPAAEKKGDKSTLLMGAGVAVAAVGSAFAFISNTLANMSGTAIWITIFCALFALLAPITILAMIKLRKQDLSSLLEGCGWAINLRMKLTSKLRGQFTNFGRYPKDAKGTPKNKCLITIIILILVIVGIFYGVKYIENNTEWGKEHGNPDPVPSVAPAATPAPAPAAPAAPAPATPAAPAPAAPAPAAPAAPAK